MKAPIRLKVTCPNGSQMLLCPATKECLRRELGFHIDAVNYVFNRFYAGVDIAHYGDYTIEVDAWNE